MRPGKPRREGRRRPLDGSSRVVAIYQRLRGRLVLSRDGILRASGCHTPGERASTTRSTREMAKETVRVLTNKDMEGLLPMDECSRACEEAFWELGHGIAQVIPRRRIHTPLREEKIWHWLNVIPGVVPRFNVAAVRLDSAQLRFREVNGRTRMDFPGAFAGFVLLFDITMREFVSIYRDHYVSPIRVGATTGIGVKDRGAAARRRDHPPTTTTSAWGSSSPPPAPCSSRRREKPGAAPSCRSSCS